MKCSIRTPHKHQPETAGASDKTARFLEGGKVLVLEDLQSAVQLELEILRDRHHFQLLFEYIINLKGPIKINVTSKIGLTVTSTGFGAGLAISMAGDWTIYKSTIKIMGNTNLKEVFSLIFAVSNGSTSLFQVKYFMVPLSVWGLVTLRRRWSFHKLYSKV